MVKFLKKIASFAPEKSVKYLLHKHLTRYEPGRSLKRIHASELTKAKEFCPRYYALSDLTGAKPQDQFLSTSQLMTFQIGRDQERNLVLWFAEMSKAFCHWKCVSCGTRHEYQLRPPKCSCCGTKVLEPEEMRFESAASSASCGVDMMLALGDPKMRIVEIKTMDKDQFKELKAPLAEHRWRTNLYLRIVEESEHPVSNLVQTDVATILYVSKGGFGVADPEVKKWGLPDGFSPFKEYLIQRNDSDTDMIVRKAKAVKDYRAEKVGIPKGVCKTALSARAKECPLKGQCFSGDYPPQFDWESHD